MVNAKINGQIVTPSTYKAKLNGQIVNPTALWAKFNGSLVNVWTSWTPVFVNNVIIYSGSRQFSFTYNIPLTRADCQTAQQKGYTNVKFTLWTQKNSLANLRGDIQIHNTTGYLDLVCDLDYDFPVQSNPAVYTKAISSISSWLIYAPLKLVTDGYDYGTASTVNFYLRAEFI